MIKIILFNPLDENKKTHYINTNDFIIAKKMIKNIFPKYKIIEIRKLEKWEEKLI